MSSSGAHPFFVAGSRMKYFSSEMFSKLKQCHKKNGLTNIFLQKT